MAACSGVASPIVIHGYDYAIPGRLNDPADPRRPSHAKKDQWLGGPLVEKGITDASLQRGIVRILIDGLYDMLKQLVAAHPHVHLVDLRKSLPGINDWVDEIHGTSAGFKDIASRFKSVIDPLI